MIKNRLHKIKDLFCPFDKTFEIVVTGENENACNQFIKKCEDFIENDELLQYGLEYDYNTQNNEFKIKTDWQNFVKFRFFYQALPDNDWDRGDILVPIFRLDRYQPSVYNCLPHDIAEFLGKVQKYKKTAITALIKFDYLCESPINNIEQWEESINTIYDILQEKMILDESIHTINRNGQKILNAVFALLQQHLNENTKYTAYNICNFFGYNETDGFSFGMEEFFSNLLLRLFSFDKLNNYEYQIK